MEQVLDYIKESYNELVNKVTWPSWSSLLSNTRLVLVASMIIALIIFLMDAVSSFILTDTIYELSR
ncbi:MAG: preprotein translocase subunit SecE [Bacteroidetes bacterium]|nr:MAG: preprotein translocase subunit SecE [Bacteroidota bacterium]